jgi:hypothetical protein
MSNPTRVSELARATAKPAVALRRDLNPEPQNNWLNHLRTVLTIVALFA